MGHKQVFRHGGKNTPMKLSDDLAQVVKRKEASRTECLRRLWTYIKNNNLRDSENKLYFFPDKKMAKVSLKSKY